MKPKISAIIPTYNRRAHVLRAIASILSQSVVPDEVLVVDDGSTDGTAEAIREAFGEAVTVIMQPNGGVSSARRRGVQAATGEWVAFLDSDDEWTPGRMEVLTAPLARLPEAVCWLFGDTLIVDDTASPRSLYEEWGGLRLDAPVTVFDDALPTQYPYAFSLLQSSLIRRSELIAGKAFAEGLRSSEDFLVSFRAALNGSFAAIPEAVTRLYRTSDLAASSLDRDASQSPDYYTARVLAFDEASRRRGPEPWGRLHEEAVRGKCIALARQGRSGRRLALEQFRHRVSTKALAFAALSSLGAWSVRLARP